MEIIPTDPPRPFRVGIDDGIELMDCARVRLQPNEQVTFTTPEGGEYDVVRKAWGFYATPSVNHRLPRFGLRAALVSNVDGHLTIQLIERGCEDLHAAYLTEQRLEVVAWLDDNEIIERMSVGED